MNIRFLALAFFLWGVTLPSYATKWILVGVTIRGDEFFIDESSTQRDGDSVDFWTKINYKERGSSGELSLKVQERINCRRREHVNRYLYLYDDADNRGRILASFAPQTGWVPVAPESMNWLTMQFVCRK